MAEAGALWALAGVTAAASGFQAYQSYDAAQDQKDQVKKQEKQAKSLLAEQKLADEQKKQDEISLAKRKALAISYKAKTTDSLLNQPTLNTPTGKSLLGS